MHLGQLPNKSHLPSTAPLARTSSAPSAKPSESQARAPVGDTLAASVSAVRKPLPVAVAKAKQAVLQIAKANTTNEDSISDVRAQLEPHVKVLSDYFRENRPANEVELTRGTWKNLWYDDPDIDRGPGFLKLDRKRIWQVVGEKFYTNVSEAKFDLFGLQFGKIQSFLKGNYTINNEAPPATPERPSRKNVIELEFDTNKAWFGGLPKDKSLSETVSKVESGSKWTIPVPGPKGIQGELWNLYVDKDIRISAGIQKGESKSSGLDLYVLERGERS